MMPVLLTGRLICESEADAGLVQRLLPDHVRLTRAELGCCLFEVTQSDSSLVWDVAERFTTRAAFEAHQARSRDSRWGRATAHIRREFTRTDLPDDQP